jgi:glycosyltransferase involved in cell wall biosynthesis
MSKLAIIIPAFNEEQGLAYILRRMPEKIEGIEKISVIVVNDGSTDNTEKVATQNGVEVISNPMNMGLGVTFKKGIERALEKGSDIIVNIDADGQFDPQDIPKLVAPILNKDAEFVTASRFKSHEFLPKMPRIRKWGNKLMSIIISKVIGKKFHDVSCGFRAFSREATLRLNLFGKFTYTQETFIDLASKNIPIIEVPVKVKGEREFGESKMSSNLFRYGINATRIIIGAFRDYKPLRMMFFLSLFFFGTGLPIGCFFIIHYIRTGAFSPHTWAGFTSSALIAFGVFMVAVGIFMEMFTRMRMNQEQLLYIARKNYYGQKSGDSSGDNH